MQPLTIATVGLVTAGGVAYMGMKVKRLFRDAPAGEQPKDWRDKLKFLHKAAIKNTQIHRNMAKAYEDAMELKDTQLRVIHNDLQDAYDTENALQNKLYTLSSGEHNYNATLAMMTEMDFADAQRELEDSKADNLLRERLEVVEREKKRLTDQYNEYMTGSLQLHTKETAKESQ
jgi:hypothetical protein